jgi:hypothetical protein
MLGVSVVSLLLLAGGLRVPFFLDDYLHQAMMTGSADLPWKPTQPWDLYTIVPGDAGFTQRSAALGTAPWWKAEAFQITFFRPLASLSLYLDHLLFPGSAVFAHLSSLIWFALLLGSVALLYRRVEGGKAAAGLAFLLFALDDAHVFPAVWAANRGALIAAVFSFLALYFHHRYRNDKNIAFALLSWASFAMGLLGGEIALSMMGFMGAFVLFLDPDGPKRGLLYILPHVAIVIVWRIVYSRLGFGVFGSDLYIDPLSAPSAFVASAARRLVFLVSAQLTIPGSEVYVLLPKFWRPLYLIFYLAWFVWAAVVFAPIVRRDRIARFWCAGMMMAAVPSAATFPHDRLMLIAGIGGMGLISSLLLSFFDRSVSLPRRKLTGAFVAWMILSHLILSPLSFPLRIGLLRNMASLADRATRSIPDSDDFENKTVIIANGPDMFLSSFIPIWRHSFGLTIPKRVETAVNTLSPVILFRDSDRSLTFTVKDGQFDTWTHALVRRKEDRMTAGYTVHRLGITFEVLTTNEDGEPITLRMSLDRPFTDPSWMWVVWDDNRYRPFIPPDIGKSVTVDIDEWAEVQFLLQ